MSFNTPLAGTLHGTFVALLRNSLYLLTTLIVLFNLSACSLAPSDEEVVRAIMTNDTLHGRLYRIQNLQRINGYNTSEGYVVECSYEICMLEDPQEFFNRLTKSGTDPLGALAAVGLAVDGIAKRGFLDMALLSAHKKGEIVPFSGSIVMIKSERGWILRPSEYRHGCSSN